MISLLFTGFQGYFLIMLVLWLIVHCNNFVFESMVMTLCSFVVILLLSL